VNRPFQRIGAQSNSHVGREFELVAKAFFAGQGIALELDHEVEIGINGTTKLHSFDLGCSEKKIIVECKSHRWTTGNNVPSAKMTVWNEAMYYFHAAPADYRKIMFVLYHYNEKRRESLAAYYRRTYNHLIPPGVEIWEFNEVTRAAKQIGI
jgi:hypothetical protein